MQLPKSLAVVGGLRFLESIDSTNAELVRNHRGLEDFSVLVAAAQTNGQGRAGRSWVSEPGASISISVLLRPSSSELANLITLLTAASIHQALSFLVGGGQLAIKWPNDILAGDRKLVGVLAQLNSDGSVVTGFGINLRSQASAPDNAFSLSEFGIEDFDEVSAACLSKLRDNWNQIQESGTSWLIDYVSNNCSTIGSMVRADLANDESIEGKATSITDDGRLVIFSDREHIIAAADVWHVRGQQIS
jgi:BirA family biotin operon repressor/biotin-[acetyl-CoA-carboxylase] ligase